MRLPRRVPWESLSELDHVCSLIYADGYDLDAKVQAVNRIAAWRAITALPHALESTQGLLCVIIEDSSRQGSTSHLSLRQSYASALIRLVNGLVDPLQFGAYARSIKSIADQLGLPSWLVELRHAATHEDLPSIEVLREAAKEAMGWLLNNYFLPTLNPSAPAPARKTELRPISPVLKRYKALLKATTRDASLLPKWKPEITKVLRDITRWVGEAKVAADVAGDALEWDARGQDDDSNEEDGRERWALDRLCDALLEKGALVPSSRKKKEAAMWAALTPPPSSIAIWQPLLSSLQTVYPSFPAVLASRVTSRLLSPSAPTQDFGSETLTFESDSQSADATRLRSLSAWSKWLVDTWAVETDEDEGSSLRREDVVISLVSALGPAQETALQDRETVMVLLRALCDGRPRLQDIASTLSSIPSQPSAKWDDFDFDVMQERLQAVIAAVGASEAETAGPADTTTTPRRTGDDDVEMETQAQLPSGWRLLSEQDGWRPAPIGVFVRVAA